MNQTVTFKSLERKYEIAKECMASNLETIENPNYPEHAIWIHHPTMVRWLYGSSQEFAKEFGLMTLSFDGTGQEPDIALRWKYDLIYLHDLMEQKIRSKYSKNVGILERLRK